MNVVSALAARRAGQVRGRTLNAIPCNLGGLRSLTPFSFGSVERISGRAFQIGNRNESRTVYPENDQRAHRSIFHCFRVMNDHLRPTLYPLSIAFILFLSILNPEELQAQVTEEQFDPKIEILSGGNKFSVPYSFFLVRPNPKKPNIIKEWKSLSFAFFMPDGSPVPYNPRGFFGFGQRNQGGKIIESDKYIVIVRALRSIYDSDAPPDPEKQLHNMMSGIPGYYTMRKIGENKYMILNAKPNEENYYFYYGFIDDDKKYLIRCIHRDADVYPACDGDVRYYKYGLNTHIQFPFDEREKIKQIAQKLDSLLSSWKD